MDSKMQTVRCNQWKEKVYIRDQGPRKARKDWQKERFSATGSASLPVKADLA